RGRVLGLRGEEEDAGDGDGREDDGEQRVLHHVGHGREPPAHEVDGTGRRRWPPQTGVGDLGSVTPRSYRQACADGSEHAEPHGQTSRFSTGSMSPACTSGSRSARAYCTPTSCTSERSGRSLVRPCASTSG